MKTKDEFATKQCNVNTKAVDPTRQSYTTGTGQWIPAISKRGRSVLILDFLFYFKGCKEKLLILA